MLFDADVYELRNTGCLRLNVITYVANYHLYAETVLRHAIVFNDCLCARV